MDQDPEKQQTEVSTSEDQPTRAEEVIVPAGATLPSSPLDIYRARMLEPTSRKDLRYMLNDTVRIIEYEQLKTFKRLDELLQPYGAVIMLYPSTDSEITNPDERVGHWVCMFVIPGTNQLEYFDSYGCYIDEPLRRDNNPLAYHEPQKVEPYLLDLILSSDYANNTFWNEVTFQGNDMDTATCGLWCVLRLKNRHLDEEAFEKLYLDAPGVMRIDPDLLVSSIICDMYPEMRIAPKQIV